MKLSHASTYTEADGLKRASCSKKTPMPHTQRTNEKGAPAPLHANPDGLTNCFDSNHLMVVRPPTKLPPETEHDVPGSDDVLSPTPQALVWRQRLEAVQERLDRATSERALLEELKTGNEQHLRSVIADKEAVNRELSRLAEELSEARAAALEQSEAKSRFLAHMSHEIRTPLNGIIGLVELLADSAVSSKQQELVRMLSVAGDNLMAIVDDVLDLAAVEADEVALHADVYDPRQVIEEVGDLLALKAEERGIRLVTHVVPGVPTRVNGDQGRVRQILVNLAVNAIKFTRTGRVVVRVGWTPRNRNPEESTRNDRLWLVFEVEDTGPGIPADQLDSVFEPFTRGPGDAGGAGLGLSIAKRLARAMDGELEVQSEPGRGALFRCRLPGRVARRSRPNMATAPGTTIVALIGDRAQALALRSDLRTLAAEVQLVGTVEAVHDRIRRGIAKKTPVTAVLLDTLETGLTVPSSLAAIPDGPSLVALTSLRERMVLSTADSGWATAVTWPVRLEALAAALAAAGVELRGRPDLSDDDAPLLKTNTDDGSTAAAGTPVAAPSPWQRPTTDPTLVAREGRVLIVEDDPINRRLAVRLLEKRNIPFDVAQDGREAVDAANDRRYALVLMDCRMPVMDGFEATRAIRSAGPNMTTPIVALTANAVVSERQTCIDAGMNEVLAKPIRSELLYQTIDYWVAKHAQDDEADKHPE